MFSGAVVHRLGAVGAQVDDVLVTHSEEAGQVDAGLDGEDA